MGPKDISCQSVRGCTLGGIHIFSKLEPSERDEVAAKMSRCVYPAKSFIIRVGESGSDVYFLVSGRVLANSLSVGGKAVHFEDLREGAMFGEWAALDSFSNAEKREPNLDSCNSTGAIRSNDCEAVTASVVVRMSSVDFIDCIYRYPSVCGVVLKRLARMARKKNQLLYESYVFSVPQRIRAELARIAEDYSPDQNGNIVVEQRITHEEIAQRIGGHREGVTIEMQYLNKAKITTWNRRLHIIHDIHKLRECGIRA